MMHLLYLSLIPTSFAPDIASLILRLLTGASFIAHGRPKLFGEQRKQNRAMMGQIGMPAGLFDAVGLLEFLGGIFLIIGLLTPVASTLFILEMLGTTVLNVSRLRKPPINAKYAGGWEVDTLLLASALALFFLGAGTLSIDYLIGF